MSGAKAGAKAKGAWPPPPPPGGAKRKSRRFRNGQAGPDDLEELLPEPEGFNGADLIGKAIPPREWLLDQWIPARQACALYGKGGVGKSNLLMLLAVCLALGLPFLGIPTKPRKVLGFFVEDGEDELALRLATICGGLGVDYTSVTGFHMVSHVGKMRIELVELKEGRLQKTKQFKRLIELIERHRPDCVMLDTATAGPGVSAASRTPSAASAPT